MKRLSMSRLPNGQRPARAFVQAVMLAFALLTISCEAEYYGLLSRKSEAPQAAAPSVCSFASLDGIPVTWEKDGLADGFVLYRQQLPAGAVVEMYRGNRTSWLDAGVVKEQVYKYTLAKIRGSREMESGLPEYGAFDDRHLMDPDASNDTKAQAQAFTTFQITDFVVYYGDGMGHTLIDADWYYTDLPSHTRKTIKLSFDDCDGNATDYDLAVETDVDNPLSTGDEFSLSNGTNEMQRAYFCVRANTSAMGPATKRMWAYKLDFIMLSIYNP